MGVIGTDACRQVRPATGERLPPIPSGRLVKERSPPLAPDKQAVGSSIPDPLTFLPSPLENLHGLLGSKLTPIILYCALPSLRMSGRRMTNPSYAVRR